MDYNPSQNIKLNLVYYSMILSILNCPEISGKNHKFEVRTHASESGNINLCWSQNKIYNSVGVLYRKLV